MWNALPFITVFLGYVIYRLLVSNSHLGDEIFKLKNKITVYETAISSIEEAKEEASQIIANANREYNQRISKAQQEVNQQLYVARQQSKNIIATGRIEADKRVKDIQNYATSVEEETNQQLKNKIKSANEDAQKFILDIQLQARQKEIEIQKQLNDLNTEYDKTFSKYVNDLDSKVSYINSIIETKIKDFPIVTSALAEYYSAIDYYRKLSMPPNAIKSRDLVTASRAEKKILKAENIALKLEIEYIRSIIPWLPELEENSIAETKKFINPKYQKTDEASHWLSPEEYAELPPCEKYQLALDRYLQHKQKSAWEIGRDYERFIGYLYEKDGYKVTYHGIKKKLEDLGIDLICCKGTEVLTIQCKYWSKNKVIHEKHINQLFGTTVMYQIEHPDIKTKITPIFITSTDLSDTAKRFANALHVEYKQIPYDKDYPIIKCNIGKGGEKIYHLPFDQQYDTCIIEPEKGEFYAHTINEAENAGFRRAMRHT